MMLWFTNLRTSPTQYLGLRYDEDDGRPTLRLLHPNGAQVTKPFSTCQQQHLQQTFDNF